MFNWEWRKHCLPAVCVGYLCISHSALPVEALYGLTWHWDVAMLQPLGALQLQTGIVQGASVLRAPILINTTCLCQTEQITLPAPSPPPPPHVKNKLALPLNQTVVSASTLKAMVPLLLEMYRGEAQAWLLIWSDLFSCATHTLSYDLRPNSCHLLL